MKIAPSEVGYFIKIADIYSTAIMAQSAETVENSHTFLYVSYTWYKSFSKRTHKKSSQAALQNGEQSSQSGAVVSTLRPKIFKKNDPWHHQPFFKYMKRCIFFMEQKR